MTQLASLTAFIENNLPARTRIPFTSDMDDITLVPFTKSLGHGQLCTQVRKYTAFLRWDAWPYRQLNPDLVFSWLKLAGRQRRRPAAAPGTGCASR
ncbi:hypothetical protein [Escherichia coli]|uniref:hypothetical protein n=1 Tax=Escherichia coli TaxID=562 RepID=UPI002FCCDD18